MDELPLKIEKIAGLSGDSTACGVFSKRITLVDGTIGIIASCVLIKNGKEDDLATLLKDIFELSTKKLESAGLGDGILDAVGLFGDATRDYLQSKHLEVSFAHTFFYKNVAYIAKFGNAVRIFVFAPPREAEIKFESGSGPVKEGQIFLVATEKFLEKFDVGIFRTEGEIDLSEIIDGLATEISTEKEQSDIGAFFCLVKEEKQPPKAVEVAQIFGEAEGEVLEAVAGEQDESASERYQPKEKNRFLKAFLAEIKKLKRGDIGAIFRLRRNIVLVIGLIAVILIISGGLTIWQKIQRGKLSEFNLHVSQASAKYTEAQAIVELNRVKAREVLGEADKEIKLALAIQKDNEKARELATNITDKLAQTEESTNVNLSVLFEAQSQINSLSFAGKNLAAFAGDKILIGNLQELSTIAGVGDTESGFVFDNNAFILAGGRVYKVDLKTDKKEELFEFAAASDVAVFLGNIYLPGGDQIAKFVPVEGGYNRSGDYLVQKTELSANTRLAIDGSVWITAGSKVLNFLRGNTQNFEISGLSTPVGHLESIYTSSNLDNIYVVDKTNSALLVISKDGVYKKAYQSPEFAKASDIVVSDDEATMYIAVGNKVLTAEL
ncbi:hypothetical protein A3F45_00750 [Candidatus Curtissbacteria bacterium RIFCSPHIGHO2_12_FULL_41_17]|uniref:PPM-type phosphatase domain-containing protein n=1 Tax=Candidatus Curtissbacteria bacterium RIFCSPHIGHO2_12_FULL_41_17 TaxID=1797722 RepID=A0A1F5HJZ4_9BACT|nr:MAG: hypothetical protein A3F45_00750 [Candidatus Curtissbacteria bacterium RIFCSPHIGHO2_12_FULL_41_17]